VRQKLAALRAEEEGGAVGDQNKGVFIRALYQEGLDEGSIVDSCLNFVIAGESVALYPGDVYPSGSVGRDTTAQALTWGFYELITNPACQAKLADAVDNLPPNCSLSEMIAQRPFLEWVISETIRMHPSAPFGVAQNTSGITHVLPDNTVVMPLDQVFWSPWSIQRYHPVFGSQPEAFIPERWETMDRKPTVYEAPAFHAGPRSCLGQQMARTEMAYVLVELVKRYEMVRAWGDGDRKLDEGMAGEMLGGLPVKVKRRV
jgi:cytochrome P450